ncbi:MAG: lipoprotein-releasing ABC transporter permease subunit [Spirochaetia bacterium]|nr:lipoprotein-releasing ABC transporter permease subunit [Spirochaetia bacterium]
MARPFNFFIGLRYLLAKKQGFISLISFISIAGIAVGVIALVVVTSVMNGFHEDIRDKIIGTNAHVVAMSYYKDGISEYGSVAKELKKIDHVEAVAPYYMGQVMLKSGDSVQGMVLWGVNPAEISKVNNLNKYIKRGDMDFIMKELPDNKSGIVVGKELLNIINADLGDDVVLISPVFYKTPAGMMPKMSKMTIVGVFEAGMYDADTTFAYVSIGTAQKLFDKPDVVTGIAIRADNLENASLISSEIHRKYKSIWARDWMSMNTNLFKALAIEKWAMGIILTLIVVVAAFNIASTLIMIVMRKTKDIGILKSMGANNSDIMNIFIIQGVATGIIGSLIGFVIGLAMCWFLKVHPLAMPGGGSVYYIDTLAVSVKWSEVILVPLISILISFLATIYPAYNAAKLDPVEAIRYE